LCIGITDVKVSELSNGGVSPDILISNARFRFARLRLFKKYAEAATNYYLSPFIFNTVV